MKIFLYWLGAMAEVGIWMVLAFLLWALTRMEVMEIIALTGVFTVGTMVLIFNMIDKAIHQMEGMEENSEQGDREQQSQDNGDDTDAVRVQP